MPAGPATLADALLKATSDAELSARIAAVRSDLALATVAELKARVDATKLRNARRALAIAEIAVQVAATTADPAAEGLALWARGNALYHLSQFSQALACYRRAEAFYATEGLAMEVMRLQINQVAVLQDLGAFDTALELAAQARAACARIGPPARPFLALLEMNSGAALQQLARADEALACYERGRAIFVALDDAVQAARMDINRANVLQELGRFDAAQELYRAAAAALGAAGADQELARAEHNIGKLAFRRGRYQEALRHLERARAGYAAIPNPLEVAKADLYRAFVYRDLGLLEEALAIAAAAGAAFARARTRWEHALALGVEGDCRARLGDAVAARAAIERARRLLRRQGALLRLPPLDLDRAALALAAGEPALARRLAGAVMRATDPEQWPALAARARMLLANAQLASGRAHAAAELARAAVALATRYDLPEAAVAHNALALAHEAAGDDGNAWAAHAAAVAAAEKLRARLPLDELRLAFLDTHQPIYQETLRHALRHRSAAVALAATELALSAPLPRAESGAADPATRAELRQLREAWAYLQSAVAEPAAPGATPAAAEQRLRELETAIGEISRRLALQSDDGATPGFALPAEAPLAEPAAIARLEALQASLAPGQALLVYAPAGDTLFALLVTPAALARVALPAGAAAVERLLRAWRFQVEHVYSGAAGHETIAAARAYLARFYTALVAPLEAQLAEVDTLSVALPPAWHDLPLAAALGPSGHLVERLGLQLVGAPGMHRPVAGLPTGLALVVGCSDDDRLPAAPREAALVAEALGGARPVRLLVEADATTAAVLDAMPACAVLHLAAHAVHRPDNPRFSWTRLADGPLAVADLAALRLVRRPLVVLSACESGRGEPRGGGLVGMARGFMLAGATGLVASLWKIADGATAPFMAAFYEQLQQHSAATALAGAQRQAIARGEHPFHWAAFVYIAG